MTISLGTAVIEFAANTTGLEGGFKKVTSMLGGLPMIGIAAAAAMAGIGVASIKAASDFEAGVTSLVTGAGESSKNIGLIEQALLKMAVTTGTSTDQLVAGMYMIDSAGYTVAKGGLQVLQAAAEGAKVGNADLGQVADATTTAMHGYHLALSQVVPTVNSLVATTSEGKMHMDDLTQAFKTSLSVTSNYLIPLNNVEAALATMSMQSDRGASAGTHLAQMIKSLEVPSSKAQTALKSIGLSAGDVAAEMQKSLPDALQMITDAVGKKFPASSEQYKAAIQAIAGGSKQMQAFLELTGQNLNDFKDHLTNISGAAKQGSDSINGWSDIQKTFNFKLDQASQAVQSLMKGVGLLLLPALGHLMDIVTPLIGQFSNWLIKSGALQNAMGFLGTTFKTVVGIVQGAIGVFSATVGWFQKNQWAIDLLVAALAGIGVAIAVAVIPGMIAAGVAAVASFGAWAIAAGAAALATLAAAAPFIIIGVIIAGVVFGVIMAIQHWGQIMTWLGGVCGAIGSFVGGVFSDLGSFLHGLISDIGGAFSGLGTLLSNIWNGIVGIIKGAINDVIGIINGFIGFIDSIQIHIPSIGVGPFHTPAFDWNGLGIPKIPYLDTGGFVQSTGLAVVHRGETVFPASTTSLSGAAAGLGGQPIIHNHNHFYVDGEELSYRVMTRADAAVRAKFGPRARS
jgi:TP901 family phage tail tape measure protein